MLKNIIIIRGNGPEPGSVAERVEQELERGQPLAERADAPTAASRAQRGAAREWKGRFGHAMITAEIRQFFSTKHYHLTMPKI